VAIGIDCTFNKRQATRGPRSLRPKTFEQIQDAQRTQTEDSAIGGEAGAPRDVRVESLVLRLCIYRLRLYPVWPIVAVEEVIASLQRDAHDVETRLLAIAVGAATMAQLNLDRFQDTGVSDNATAASLEAECQRIRGTLSGGAANLNSIRTAFFLHIYHENQLPGGTNSLLHLREAITLGQIMGLHRASSYLTLSPSEDRLHRRLLWLLFVTERGVAMLHKLPVVLQRAEKLPPLDNNGVDEEAHILPAFKKLVDLFWVFDQSRTFDVLQEASDRIGGTATGSAPSLNSDILDLLQQKLYDVPVDLASGGNDVQKADIFVTRQWMQVLLWRATLCNWAAASPATPSACVARPIQIAQEFLDLICQLPHSALESHGSAIEFKVYEIASAVADSLEAPFCLPNTDLRSRPRDVLVRLQRILATSRGGNTKLLQLLALRISHAETPFYPISGAPLGLSTQELRMVEEVDEGWGINSTSTSEDTEQSFQDDSPTLNPSPSPWLSLVAAAEIEQEAISYGNNCANNAAAQLSSSPLGTDWQVQTPRLSGNTPLGLSGNTTYENNMHAPPDGTLSPGRVFADMLSNQNWFLGFDAPRSS